MLFRALRKCIGSRPGHYARRRPPATRRLMLEPLESRLVPTDLTVVMSGLDNPRGLAFGPEGGLYVAEAGRGGDGPAFEVRPGTFVSYGPSGAVSRYWHGQQERVATGLPSLAPEDGSGATGPSDIAFDARGHAFVTIGLGTDPTRRDELGDVGAGFGQLVRLRANGHWRDVADVSAYEVVANPDGGAIDSNPYGLLAERGSRVVVDAGGNSLLRVAANGNISTLAVFPSRAQGRGTDAVPTSVAVGPDGAYYVGELTGVPFTVGAANIYRVVPGEEPQVVYGGFTAIIDITFGPDDSLYVLQHATGPGLTGDGALIRVAPDGTRTTLASEGLSNPTSVVVGTDGAIYVSNRGTFAGTGEVVCVTPTPAPHRPGRVWNDARDSALPAPATASPVTTPAPRPRSATTDPARPFEHIEAAKQRTAPADFRVIPLKQTETVLMDALAIDAWLAVRDLLAWPTK